MYFLIFWLKLSNFPALNHLLQSPFNRDLQKFEKHFPFGDSFLILDKNKLKLFDTFCHIK